MSQLVSAPRSCWTRHLGEQSAQSGDPDSVLALPLAPGVTLGKQTATLCPIVKQSYDNCPDNPYRLIGGQEVKMFGNGLNHHRGMRHHCVTTAGIIRACIIPAPLALSTFSSHSLG